MKKNLFLVVIIFLGSIFSGQVVTMDRDAPPVLRATKPSQFSTPQQSPARPGDSKTRKTPTQSPARPDEVSSRSIYVTPERPVVPSSAGYSPLRPGYKHASEAYGFGEDHNESTVDDHRLYEISQSEISQSERGLIYLVPDNLSLPSSPITPSVNPTPSPVDHRRKNSPSDISSLRLSPPRLTATKEESDACDARAQVVETQRELSRSGVRVQELVVCLKNEVDDLKNENLRLKGELAVLRDSGQRQIEFEERKASDLSGRVVDVNLKRDELDRECKFLKGAMSDRIRVERRQKLASDYQDYNELITELKNKFKSFMSRLERGNQGMAIMDICNLQAQITLIEKADNDLKNYDEIKQLLKK